ncbi:MAG: GPW/gp25 family protein [Crocinitomicaceae bacterium]|nr:GPW/gp25 family protein [Flavobacteriales bacterium]NQZ35592.1 GPW/gp25 family protein [Crocinitomicaceae bacterium]PHR27474.1 MAG: lysozyme [Fluviicola sp.]
MKYIKLPINFSDLVNGKPREECSYEESIAQYLMMMITSRYGEIVSRSDFGSAIWELEFNQIVRVYEWEEKVQKSLEDTIAKYESRLSDLKIDVSLTQIDTDLNYSEGTTQVRKQATISVEGKIKHSGTRFMFNTQLLVSPLSQ